MTSEKSNPKVKIIDTTITNTFEGIVVETHNDMECDEVVVEDNANNEVVG